MASFAELKELITRLMDPEQGCTWLSAQDFTTIAPYTIEEAYELVEAIERGDYADINAELADQLYHLLIYSELGRRSGQFDLDKVIETAYAKQTARRDLEQPNKFATPEQAHADWREQKRRQKQQANPTAGILSEIPVSMPALVRSKKLQDRAGHVGFDWDNVHEVLEKLHEEVAELEHEVVSGDKERMLDELGDILFTAVNVGRHLGLDAEQALRHSNNKFRKRFEYIEKQLQKDERDIACMSFEELLEIWEQAKQDT